MGKMGRFRKRGANSGQNRPPRQWGIDVAVGTALLTVGVGASLSLVISAALGTKSLWSHGWFEALFSVMTLLGLLGLYMLAAVYFRLPLPETRAARETRAELSFGVVRICTKGPGFVVVEVPLTIGHADIENASINVLVPDWLTIVMSSREGEPAPQPLAGMQHTPESLYLDGRCESNFWTQPFMKFPAFTNLPLCFKLEPLKRPTIDEPFPFRFVISAATLHGEVKEEKMLDPSAV